LTTQKIISIEPISIEHSKWDLETETHNYFANNVLVHNSNAGFCHDGEQLVVKSRNFYKKRDQEDMWWEAALRYDLETKLAKYPLLVFFAECIGNIKKFRYNAELVDGKLLTKLYFFDIWDTKTMRYRDYDRFVEVCADVGVETTPILYRGPWLDTKEMYGYAERQTILGGKHIAEGWVLSLGKERFEPRLNSRLKLKYVSEAYNLQK
jgi:RNA ligase-like protein